MSIESALKLRNHCEGDTTEAISRQYMRLLRLKKPRNEARYWLCFKQNNFGSKILNTEF